MDKIVYLTKGWRDGIDEEDLFQCIGIDTETFEIVNKEELIFESDIPDTSYVEQNWENILSLYELKGWRI